MEIGALFKESFLLLLRQPKLFLPKIVVAFLYGIGMIAIAGVSLETLLPILTKGIDIEIARSLAQQIPFLIAFFFYLIAVLAIDVLVNAMYPVMIRDSKQGDAISFRKAFGFALSKFAVVFPAVIVVELAIALPFSILSSLLLLSGNIPALIASFAIFLAVSFALIVLFYVVYPVSVLQEKNFIAALLSSISLGRQNMRQLSMPSLIPFFLSLVNFALAFLAKNPAFLAAFILLRFLIPLVYTYHMVLNPTVYFALVGEEGG